MGYASIWHWLVLLIFVVAVIIPLARVLSRTGHSGWWSVLYLLPLVNVIALWIFAYKKWPIDER